MTIKVFFTGVTGFIGGDAWYRLNEAHSDWEYAFLVRTQEKADEVTAKYPKARPVLGDLDMFDLIKAESSKADIVLHTADSSDHEGSARAIAAGLAEGHTAEKPGYWLHTGGTGILTYFDDVAGRLGEWDERQFNDWEGVAALTGLPDPAFHRNVDKIVLGAAAEHGDAVKVALVCPPTIYGPGRGPVSGRSRQAYELTRLILRRGVVPIIGQGRARWNSVHVHDLSDAFGLLADAAVVARNHSPEVWGPGAYHLAENGEFVWGELARLVGRTAVELGYFQEAPKEEPLSRDEAFAIADFQAVSWGLNSRGKAIRLRRTLGWNPHRPSIEEEVPAILKSEKERLEKEG